MFTTQASALTENLVEDILWCHEHNVIVTFKNPNSVELRLAPHSHRIYAYSLHDAVESAKATLALKEKRQ